MLAHTHGEGDEVWDRRVEGMKYGPGQTEEWGRFSGRLVTRRRISNN